MHREVYRRWPCLFAGTSDWESMAKKMRAVQIPKAKGPLEVVEREIPEPKSGWVRVKVDACGVCHSDSLVKDGLWPGLQYPRVPGRGLTFGCAMPFRSVR